MESIAKEAIPAQAKPRRTKPKNRFPFAYIVVLAGIALGWYVRDQNLINPADGTGYWLGIIGASMMLILLLYPLRKRFRVLRFLGAVPHWFRLHMLFGLFGPLLILFHSNFSLGSINSQIAMFCMLTVAASGVIGRHLYTHIHHGLYGRKASLLELQKILKDSHDSSGVDRLPRLAAALDVEAAALINEEPGRKVSYLRSLQWALGRPLLHSRVKRAALEEIKQLVDDRKQRRQLRKTALAYINQQFENMRSVAQFQFYERLFLLWHVLHLPLFFMLILSAIAHVVAVHMY